MDLNPECKLFIGGLNKNTVVATLKRHFEQWGDLVDSVVIAGPDRLSRGFGFVTYSKLENVEKCLSSGPHVIDDREVDVKRAVPKELNRGGGGENGSDSSIKTKKVFLGGLPLQITQEEIQEEMEQFGEIEEVVIIKEKMGSSPRGFGFVIFKTYDGAANACSKRHIKFKNFMDRDIEAKPARSVDEMKQASGSGRDRDRWEDDRRDRGYRGGGHRGDRGSRDYPPRDGPSHRGGDKYSRSQYKGGGGGGPEPYGMRADYRDREPLYTSSYRSEFSGRSPGAGYDSGGVGMDRYGDYRPPPIPSAGPRAGYDYGSTGSGSYGPGPGYESGSGGFGSGGFGTGSEGGYGIGSGGSYGTGSGGGYGTGSGGGYGTGSAGGYGSGSSYGTGSGGSYDIGGYGGYSSSMGSGAGPMKSHDRPALLPSRGGGSIDPGSHSGGPYGGLGSDLGRFGGPRNNGGGGYHPYKR